MASLNVNQDLLNADDHDFSRDFNGSLNMSPDRPMRKGKSLQSPLGNIFLMDIYRGFVH